MEEIQRKRMLWRIPLLIAILMATFWGIWYLVAGEVPIIHQIKWDQDTIIQLPFRISRLWDIVFAPIWTFLLILLFTNDKIKKDEDLTFGLGVGLGIGLGVGLVFGLGVGLGVGLGIGLGVGLGIGLGVGLVFGLGVGLGFGLGVGLGVGLGIGLGVGLGIGLVFGLGVGLVFGLVLLVKFIFSRKSWSTISHWLTGKN